MKRRQIIGMCMAAALTLGACPVKAAVKHVNLSVNLAEAESHAKMKELSRKLSVQMAEGKFDEVYGLFSDSVKIQLTKELLESTWKTTTQEMGSYIECMETEVSESKNMITASTLLKYEKKLLKVSYAFDTKGEIAGLWLKPENLPVKAEVNEFFEETAIQIGTYQLDGLLTLPKGVENPPIVILVQGSGSSDMNEAVNENRPFQDIARGLAKQGIASIRYNKRYFQYPEKADIAHMTIQDEVTDDVDAAIEFAKSCKEVDSDRIILAGHSLGGMLAPSICARHPEIAGMISLAGSPRNLADIVYDQNKDALDQMQLGSKDKKQALKMVKDAVEEIKGLKEDDGKSYLTIPGSYWASLNQLETAEQVKKLDIPMLFLQGRADFQVKMKADFSLWHELLKEKENCTFLSYGKLNHIFMQTNGKRDVTEYSVPGHVEEKVILDMADWIHGIQ